MWFTWNRVWNNLHRDVISFQMCMHFCHLFTSNYWNYRRSRSTERGRDPKLNNGRGATLLKTSPPRLSKTTSSSKGPPHPRHQMPPSTIPQTPPLTRDLLLRRESPPGRGRPPGEEIRSLPEGISKLRRSGALGFGLLCWIVLWIIPIGGSMEWAGSGKCLGKYYP